LDQSVLARKVGHIIRISIHAEGAFGSVDKCKLQHTDGSIAYVAVKRLKKNMIPEESEVRPLSDDVIFLIMSRHD
jgi:FKBP-type peptidyl-prolyl cis-trans isomerase 2